MSLDIPFDNSYARLPERFYARQPGVPVRQPSLIAVNQALAAELGLDADALSGPDGLAALSGNAAPQGAEPLAQAYAGHQFGGFNPQLGDGRALLLGEVIDRNGRRRDLQLKGAGKTPFSRMGDGRNWVGPVLREYIVSEAMHAMGIPTTRALAAVGTGEPVVRETGPMPGAVLTRVASSHIRVGTFQYFAARQDDDALRRLTEYTIDRHHPEVADAAGLLDAAVTDQARLIARWLGVGFIHGVMNTDNCALSGETIDYGPCAFMDRFSAGKVFSSIDQGGRYAYARQPQIAAWNLAQLATCLLPLIDDDRDAAIERATEIVNRFPDRFAAEWVSVFRAKLGLRDIGDEDGDAALINDLLTAMEAGGADFTITFAGFPGDAAQMGFVDPAAFEAWRPAYDARLAAQGGADAAAMASANPQVIPRNHQIEAVIAAAVGGDFAPFERVFAHVTQPFTAAPADLTAPPLRSEEVTMTFCGT